VPGGAAAASGDAAASAAEGNSAVTAFAGTVLGQNITAMP